MQIKNNKAWLQPKCAKMKAELREMMAIKKSKNKIFIKYWLESVRNRNVVELCAYDDFLPYPLRSTYNFKNLYCWLKDACDCFIFIYTAMIENKIESSAQRIYVIIPFFCFSTWFTYEFRPFSFFFLHFICIQYFF